MATESEEEGPFLAIMVRGGGGELVAKQLPEGFLCIVHESAQKETGIMAVTKIRMKSIDMQCMCGLPNCDLVIRWRAEKSGRHPLMEERG